jgi:hypothetical protein
MKVCVRLTEQERLHRLDPRQRAQRTQDAECAEDGDVDLRHCREQRRDHDCEADSEFKLSAVPPQIPPLSIPPPLFSNYPHFSVCHGPAHLVGLDFHSPSVHRHPRPILASFPLTSVPFLSRPLVFPLPQLLSASATGTHRLLADGADPSRRVVRSACRQRPRARVRASGRAGSQWIRLGATALGEKESW